MELVEEEKFPGPVEDGPPVEGRRDRPELGGPEGFLGAAVGQLDVGVCGQRGPVGFEVELADPGGEVVGLLAQPRRNPATEPISVRGRSSRSATRRKRSIMVWFGPPPPSP